jgi:uncharacterized protein
MGIIGQVESVWRYPVKSMRGEAMVEIFAGFSGVYGDRLYALMAVLWYGAKVMFMRY